MEAPCPLLTPMVEFQLDLLERGRKRMLAAMDGLSHEQWHKIPAGFHNNLLWNLGHVITAQQILCYEKSGLPLRIPGYFPGLFSKGTRPGDAHASSDVEALKTWAVDAVGLMREDIRRNLFRTYESYTTGFGATLNDFCDALTYAAWHDAIHLGVVLSIRKLV